LWRIHPSEDGGGKEKFFFIIKQPSGQQGWEGGGKEKETLVLNCASQPATKWGGRGRGVLISHLFKTHGQIRKERRKGELYPLFTSLSSLEGKYPIPLLLLLHVSDRGEGKKKNR